MFIVSVGSDQVCLSFRLGQIRYVHRFGWVRSGMFIVSVGLDQVCLSFRLG